MHFYSRGIYQDICMGLQIHNYEIMLVMYVVTFQDSYPRFMSFTQVTFCRIVKLKLRFDRIIIASSPLPKKCRIFQQFSI